MPHSLLTFYKRETVCDFAVQEDRNGFRLPTSDEWMLAARYIDGKYWTPELWASGARADHTDAEATQKVAWYRDNSHDPKIGFRSWDVAQKRPNQLVLYDISGNVWEWCFTEN